MKTAQEAFETTVQNILPQIDLTQELAKINNRVEESINQGVFGCAVGYFNLQKSESLYYHLEKMGYSVVVTLTNNVINNEPVYYLSLSWSRLPPPSREKYND